MTDPFDNNPLINDPPKPPAKKPKSKHPVRDAIGGFFLLGLMIYGCSRLADTSPSSSASGSRSTVASGGDRRDQFGNLVSDQFDNGLSWTYSGPDDKLQVTRATLKVLLQTCKPLTARGVTLDKGELSYVVLDDKSVWGELAGFNMVMARLVLHTTGGSTEPTDVAFLMGRTKRPEIVTNPIGARFCGVSPAPRGQPWTHIPAPALASVMPG